MPPAARIGDSTSHGGVIGPPPPPAAVTVSTVFIAGKPAAVVGGVHACAMPLHVPLGPANVIMPKPPRPTGQTFIGGLPAACVGDKTTCGATIVVGAPNVLIGGVL